VRATKKEGKLRAKRWEGKISKSTAEGLPPKIQETGQEITSNRGKQQGEKLGGGEKVEGR